jgi:hypothetical protein
MAPSASIEAKASGVVTMDPVSPFLMPFPGEMALSVGNSANLTSTQAHVVKDSSVGPVLQ